MQVRIHPASPNDAPAAVGLMAQLAEFSHDQVDAGVEELIVNEGTRGQGVGRALIQAVID